MFHPLVYLSALSLLTGAAADEIINGSSVLNTSCPFNYYGQTYKQIYVTLSNDTFAICFNGFYDPRTRGDCIVGPQFPHHRITFYTYTWSYYPHYYYCNMGLYTSDYYNYNFSYTQFYFHNSDREASVSLYGGNRGSWVYNVQVNGVTVDTLNITNNPSTYSSYASVDIRGCRLSGVVYKPGAVLTTNPENCSSVICDEALVLRRVTCNPWEQCQGNGICASHTCTVTGPTVIDFNGQLNSIQDRCTYSLLSHFSVPSLQVLANFQERRRKDVSFLDSVTLVLNGSDIHIHLKQGGVVQVNDTPLTLNGLAEIVDGVELSKDQTGVTAKLTFASYTASVFFDGYTAQIHTAVPAGTRLSGLCTNSSVSLSQVMLPGYSDDDCEILYDDAAYSTVINCPVATQRCNDLRAPPFTSCNTLVDPQPYINACVDTLRRYPLVDKLYCQFLQAYARACSLSSNDSVGNWWSGLGCSPPQAFCQDRICSSHEFCGQNADGGISCLCRALFAASYDSTGALGNSVVCSHNSASITLAGCLLERRNINYLTLHLNNRSCTGQMDELTHMITFNFNTGNTCGALITYDNDRIEYSNTITAEDRSPGMNFSMNFSCYYTEPEIKSIGFRFKSSSVIQQITSGAWSYNLTMTSYTSVEVRPDQRIWVELKADGLNDSMVFVVTDSCWASTDQSPRGGQRYNLIMNGCPATQSVKMQGNGQGTSNHFSFTIFQLNGQIGDVYLHCKVQLCVIGNNCIPVCKGVARRCRFTRNQPMYEEDSAAFVTMNWTS
ncbi:uncharacterized protein LOC114862591 [Betta splendens]|uniref:Uncharacterized protein LOC114862591 n=1 Tax=Betta splendens TaxID=158456 RepID=A0A6P7NMX0_BETSP|nr:uncharacterized protein LOC114862591 [Betta splendens]